MNKTSRQRSTFRRLLSYIVRNAKILFFIVCVAVVLSTAANVSGSMFTQTESTIISRRFSQPQIPIFPAYGKRFSVWAASI